MPPESSAGSWKSTLSAFFIRQDKQYDELVSRYQAKSASGRGFYLFFHLLPGIVFYLLLNVSSVHDGALRLTGLPDNLLQYLYLIAFTFLWHMLVPLLVLRRSDKLSFRDSLAFLGLDRFDTKGVLLVLPIVFVVFAVVTIPYMKWVFPPLYRVVAAIPGLAIPAYSIFQPGKLYAFPPLMLLFLFIGNFVGEEVYFRGYLLKKIGFLGAWDWVVNSILFAIYHLWQAPQTWPLVVPALGFGLLMRWRKNLYPLIVFHLLLNLVWSAIIAAVLGSPR